MAQKSVSSRSAALGVLGQVLSQNRFSAEALDQALQAPGMSVLDRALTTQLVYGVLREKGFLDTILAEFISFAKTPSVLQNLLRLGVYQLYFLAKVPEHAAVFETVELAKSKSGPAAGKLLNAVLRRALESKERRLRERREILKSGKAASLRDFSCALSLPPSLVERWLKIYSSERLVPLAEYFNSNPSIFLRIHAGKAPEIIRRFSEAGLEGDLVEPGTLRLRGGLSERLRPFLEAGEVSIQDWGSQKILRAVGAKRGEVGLDACAGHGGKLSGIAEALPSDARIFAHEPLAAKRKQLEDNFKRLGLKRPAWLQAPGMARSTGLSFDWILVDAPCSGTGTLGRKPEIRWRFRATEIARHAKLQQKILREWSDLLKPGGRLIYAVCSLEPEEGSEVIQNFLQDAEGWCLIEEHALLPHETGHDGFYWAHLSKSKTCDVEI